MKILISILASNKSMSTISRVMDSIYAAIDNTDHECSLFIATEQGDVDIIGLCEHTEIRYGSVKFDESKFTRMTSFSLSGYDEFQLHKISELRNLCIYEATNGDFDYILFVDSDNILPINAIDMLIDSGKKDIAGWYYCKTVPSTTAWKTIPNQKNPFAVSMATCGCRLIHSDIFKNIKFVYANMKLEELQFSDDVKKLGFQSWIHPEVYSDHIGGGYTDEARAYKEAQLNK